MDGFEKMSLASPWPCPMARRSGWRRALLIALVVALAACGKQEPPLVLEAVEGRPFPLVALPQSAGNAVPIQAFRGRMLVLNVWATWCPPCRREMPSLERLSRTLDPRRFLVIGLSTDQDEQLAREFLLQNGITFKNYFDRDKSFAKQLNLTVYPETFLIAPNGILVRRIVGLREWDSEEALAQLEFAYLSNQK